MLNFKVETRHPTNAPTATVEVATMLYEDERHTALGSVVDHEAGHVVGYVSDDGRTLTTFQGEPLGTLKMVGGSDAVKVGRRWREPTLSYRAVIDGRRYHGRGAGPGMLLRLRASRGR
jgi:hypothetical protein